MFDKLTPNASLLFKIAAAVLLITSCVSAEEATESGIKKKLTTKVTFQFVDMKLEDAIAFVAKEAKVTITFDPKAPLDKTPPINLAVTSMECEMALQWILKLADFQYVIRKNDVFVSKLEDIPAEKRKKLTEQETASKTPESVPLDRKFEAKNSFLKANVGDWTEYTFRTISKDDLDGSEITYIKHTIQSITADKIVIGIDFSKPDLNFKRHETRELTIDRNSMGPERQKDGLLWGHVAKFPSDIETEGDEPIPVGNKLYASHFVEQIYQDKRHEGAISSKVWISNTIPLGGIVKCVRLRPGETDILEFIGAGSAK